MPRTTEKKPSNPAARWYEVKAQAGKKAEILIYDVIGKDYWGDDSAVEAKKFIADLKALNDADVDIRINSPGGSVWEGFPIYNALLRHKGEVTVYVDGMALSMASVIAMAGKKVIMAKNAMMMIHKPLTEIYGNTLDLQKAIERLIKHEANAIAAYQDKTAISTNELAAMLAEETWMTADECLELGFCDEVTSAVEIDAMAFDLERYKNVPDSLSPKAVNQPPKTQAGGDVINQPKEETTMPITMDQLQKEAPELMSQLKGEGKTEALKELETVKNTAKEEGRKEERERIQAIENLAGSGFDDIVNECKFDGKTQAPDVAMKIVAAQKTAQSNTLANLRKESPEPVSADAEGEKDKDGDKDPTKETTPLASLEEAEKIYNSDERVRKTFTSAKNFFSFRKHAGK